MNSMTLNMLEYFKPFLCPGCNSTFSSKEIGARYNVTRFPRLLPCCHTVCENCLSAAANKRNFKCPTCEETIDLSEDSDILSRLQPDVHSLGILSVNMKNSLPSIKMRMGSYTGSKKFQSQESLRKSVCTLTCQHCYKNEALYQCDECQINFCSICYGDVHNDIKLKKKHEAKKIFAELYNSMVQEGCPEHENKAVEFYCEIDDQLTCSYCMLMGKHVGHKVKTLLDKNRSCAISLKCVLDDVSLMQKQLKYTDHLLCEIIPKEKIDTSHLVKEIHDYFHKLHALLQIRESEVIDELSKVSMSNISPLEEMRLKVTSLERDLAAMKKDAESVIENPCLAISAPAVLKKLEECKSLPCHLVPLQDAEDAKYVSIDLQLDPELENQIKQFGQLKCNTKPKYQLMSKSELPEGFTPLEIPENFDPKIQDTESCATSVDNFSEDSLSVGSSFSSLQTSLKCRAFTKMTPERVIVTHIKSPSSFYVQKLSDAKKLKNMSDGMNRYCRQYEGRKSIPSEVIPGDLYLVKYSEDNQWYRGRIKNVIDSENANDDRVIGKKTPLVTCAGKVIVKDKEVKAEVFYIDYGNSEIVSIHNIRNITPRFLCVPSLAKECCLADINPVHGRDWSEQCTQTFTKFVGNKHLIMQVYEERNNIFFVDLCQGADNEISCDVPVSVRDALVFLEFAVFPSNIKSLSPNQKKKNVRSYMPPESLRVNANIWAIVSHVDSPHNFYVQQMSTASYLSTLIFEMNEAYNKDVNPLLHSVYVPYVGLICAAQFSLDKQWYRAEVIGLPGGAKVQVRYVDFGNTEIIHHKFLRKLFDRFLKLNIQAIPCKLAHVSYNQEKSWSNEAKEWLTNEVSRKQLTVKAIVKIPGENKTEVVLYYSDEEYDICVNASIVQKGLATATGPFGSSDVKIKKEILPPKEKLSGESLASISDQNSSEIIPPPTEKSSFSSCSNPRTPPRAGHKAAPIEKAMASPKKYPTLAHTSKDEDSEYVEVLVSHIESPGCFYIRIVGDTEKKLESLMTEIQKFYENLEGDVIECHVKKAYAVYRKKDKKWYRGAVITNLSDDTVKVQFVDYGFTEEVDRKDLRKLIDRFARDEAYCIQCHLDGIIPTGGSTEWSGTACDALKRSIESCKTLFLSCKGEAVSENNSLPADLLIEKLTLGGALEPSKLDYISITKELIKYGLGLPIRKKINTAAQDTKTQESVKPANGEALEKEYKSWADQVEKSEENCVDSVKEVPQGKEENTVETTCDPIILPPAEPALPKFQWKPAVLPIESSFRGYVTNIGEDGTIHLYIIKDGTSQIDIIKNALQFKFAKNAYKPLKVPPPVGEACIAKFPVDNQWYRAEVLSFYSPDKIKVNFVDYGNNEWVPLKDIRPEVITGIYPRLCIECSLFGIEDNFKWDTDVITFLHGQLVETEVNVEVKGPSKDGKLPCQIKTLSNIDISELLLSMGFDGFEDDSEDLNGLSASRSDLSTFRTFAPPKEWREGDLLPVCVTQVPSANIVYLQQLKIADPKDDFERELDQMHESFLQLIAELRLRADSFPKLKEPLPGMPCCAKYSYDKNWYRCEITDFAEDGVVVLYVDYGNTEVVSTDDLRELESSFIDFPVQIYFCELHGVKPVGSDWDPKVHERLEQKLMVSDQQFVAKVVVSGKISQIDILSEIDGQYKLVYEDLVQENLIKLEK